MKATKPRNLLVILADQQRADTLSCYGNTYIQTPNLDALANRSYVFQHAYCTQPVCTPSRGSIMTGLWPHTHGSVCNNIPLRPDVPTISEMLGDEYFKAYCGKWHLGDEVTCQRGFDEWISIEDGYTPDGPRRSDYHSFLVENGFVPDEKLPSGERVFSRKYAAVMAEPYTKAAFVGQQIARLIRQAASSERPFLIMASFLEPHSPFFSPLNGLYNPDEIPVSPTFAIPPGEGASNRVRQRAAEMRAKGFNGFPLGNERQWRRVLANYYGLVTLVDRAVGHIIAALRESGQEENTAVVFTSDHGEMMGNHGLITKGVMYEEAIRIPLLLRVPWESSERRHIPGRVSQIDLVPTLLELLERPIPSHVQGTSRVPVLRGQESLDGNDVVVQWNSQSKDASNPGSTGELWRTIISDGWKLNLCRDDRCELYDLNRDPFETENLFFDAQHRQRVQELTDRLMHWQKSVGDEAVLLPD